MNRRFALRTLAATLLAAPAIQAADRREERRAARRVERQEGLRTTYRNTLDEAFTLMPELRGRVEKAAGHAVFSNLRVQVLLLGGGGGGGLLKDRSGKETFMRMGEAAVGIGLGARQLRALFIFHDEATLNRFRTQGWEFGGRAEAAAVASGNVGAAGTVSAQAGGAGASAGAGVEGGAGVDAQGTAQAAGGSGMEIYEFTRNGLVLRAAINGTRFWVDGDLN
jgi:hypothetical protein